MGTTLTRFRKKLTGPHVPWKRTMNHVCLACNKESLPGESFMRCSICRIARYCSTDCQRREWKTHKIRCREQAEIHSRDRFVTKVNDLFYGRNSTIVTLGMVLLGTDREECSRRSIVLHVKDDRDLRRAKVVSAHAGPRTPENEATWAKRDAVAADNPDMLSMVVEIVHGTTAYSRLYSIDASDMAGSVAMMRDDADTFVRMAIDAINA